MGNARQRRTYLQVMDQLKKEIDEGLFTENERFPSEFQLAQRLDADLSYVRQAIQSLIKEKVIVQKHGVGIFVNPRPLFTAGIEELESVTSMIRKAGMEPGTIFIDFMETDTKVEDEANFNCKQGEDLLTVKRVRTANGQPVVFCIDQVLVKNLSISTEELLHTSMFDAIERSGEIRIEQAIAQIEPIGYDEEASSYLRCGMDVPLLGLEQKHYSSKGDMILYSKNYFRADKFSFHVIRKRV